jgi:hydrogenase/urease accessory protein HupE
MNRCFPQAAIFLLLFLLGAAGAHPIPDIPVRTFFPGDGTARITVEVDPRCFEPDPNVAPSLTLADFAHVAEGARAEMQQKAADLVRRYIEFTLEPLGPQQPAFKFAFTGHGGAELTAPDNVVVLTGEWLTPLPAGLSGWRIRATKEAKLSVIFQNIIRGEVHPRLMVLFPGETSYSLDIAALATVPAAAAGDRVSPQGSWTDRWSTFGEYFRQGFIHVVPEGVDHILFVLGLFLLSRSWRPLLLQVTTFTLAHSVTLALATLGMVKVSPSIVEPIIAASIAFVAIENIFRPRYSHWRLLVVFVFGLIHGLGFAGALSELDLPQNSLVACLVGFNLGVEGGQLAVIGAAFAVTFWLRDPASYRRWIVIPGSAAIAICGLWWTVTRIMGE